MLLTFARWSLAASAVFVFAVPDLRRDGPVIRRNTGVLMFFGTALAILILGEPLETFHIAALALVVAGIGLAECRTA